MSDGRPEVRVGEQHYVLRPFKGFKALLLLERVTKLLDVLPEIQAEARTVFRKQREANQVEIPRNVFEFRYPEYAGQITDKAWEEANQVIRIPEENPFDSMAAFMAVLPKVLSKASGEAAEILALVTMNDNDLQAFDEQDIVQEEVEKRAKALLYQGDVDELIDLAGKSFDLVQGMNSGKVRELFSQMTALLGPDLTEDDDPLPIPEEEATPETSSETSSISSPESTDGLEGKPSGSVGMTSSPLPSA